MLCFDVREPLQAAVEQQGESQTRVLSVVGFTGQNEQQLVRRTKPRTRQYRGSCSGGIAKLPGLNVVNDLVHDPSCTDYIVSNDQCLRTGLLHRQLLVRPGTISPLSWRCSWDP